ELADIAKVIYPSLSSVDTYGNNAASWDTIEVVKLGIAPSSVSSFYLWSSEEDSSTINKSRHRYFSSGGSDSGTYYTRNDSSLKFVCLADN
ncbi:hypothetical protein IJ579_04385, partial [bacterium]|nr:hypothetical protein [bacterium]